ncbi:MAG TPA: YdbH domain-containing protein [Rhizomicrobium sp.]|nr:YdbH domain-containing protein [Rhizomicrobium sp.]
MDSKDHTSSGTLSIGGLDFLTPMGRAHGLKTTLALVSLMPFKTADNQRATISHVDWTLPFSQVDLRFSLDSQRAKLEALAADWAQGHVALGPVTINLAAPSTISGTARLSSIALDSLITASNLENRVKLAGKVSGSIPFAATPEDIRITDGHLAADGPGRLSVNRSLWVQESAAAPNAVQDFAYQALENLAFDQLSADLNSVANGRLQILFHIKGHSDPPRPQTAEVAISDIFNGTALQKPIPLPSGTPIDLTLDTSLNFDELLKSYANAWSMSLGPAGQPDSGAGAKP